MVVFQNRLAVVSLRDNNIVLSFDEPFLKFKADDEIEVEFFNPKQIIDMVRGCKLRKLPAELHSENEVDTVYSYIKRML